MPNLFLPQKWSFWANFSIYFLFKFIHTFYLHIVQLRKVNICVLQKVVCCLRCYCGSSESWYSHKLCSSFEPFLWRVVNSSLLRFMWATFLRLVYFYFHYYVFMLPFVFISSISHEFEFVLKYGDLTSRGRHFSWSCTR